MQFMATLASCLSRRKMLLDEDEWVKSKSIALDCGPTFDFHYIFLKIIAKKKKTTEIKFRYSIILDGVVSSVVFVQVHCTIIYKKCLKLLLSYLL